jgi:hypothetical protein
LLNFNPVATHVLSLVFTFWLVLFEFSEGPFLGTSTTHFNFFKKEPESKLEPKLGTGLRTSSKTHFTQVFAFIFLTKIFSYFIYLIFKNPIGLRQVVHLRKEIKYAFFWRNKFSGWEGWN